MAICKTCHKTTYWRNQRGNSMPKTCSCGGELVRAVMTRDGYTEAQRPASVKRTAAVCALCGRKGMLPGRMVKLSELRTYLVSETTMRGLLGSLFSRQLKKEQLGPGAIVCWSHESVEEHQARGFTDDPYPVTRRILRMEVAV